MPPCSAAHRRGFALPDLLAALAVLSVIAAIVVTRAVASRESAALTQCTANLAKVNKAVLGFAEDHAQTLPNMVQGQGNLWWWYKEQVKRYAGITGDSSTNDIVFGCPRDRGYSDPIPFRLNGRFDYSSYVFNGVTLPGMPNIAGWRTSAVNRPNRTLLTMEWTAHAPLSWHRSRTGRNNMPFYSDAQSVVGFVDGHVAFSKIYYDGFNAAYTRDPIPGYDYQYSGN